MKKDIIEKYFQAWINVDLEVVKQTFSENAVYSECYGPEYRGLSQIVKWYFKCSYEGSVDGFDGVTISDFDQDMKIVKLCEYQSKAEHYYPYWIVK